MQSILLLPFTFAVDITAVAMLPYTLVALSGLAGHVAAQGGYGVELDMPMLGGGARNSKSAMLRFGCSQVVIERLDP